jgi:hypothetical protein
MPDEPKIIICKVYTANGWSTTVTMPDGSKYCCTVKRLSPGSFGGTDDGDFDEDDLPLSVVFAVESTEDGAVSQYLASQYLAS